MNLLLDWFISRNGIKEILFQGRECGRSSILQWVTVIQGVHIADMVWASDYEMEEDRKKPTEEVENSPAVATTVPIESEHFPKACSFREVFKPF